MLEEFHEDSLKQLLEEKFLKELINKKSLGELLGELIEKESIQKLTYSGTPNRTISNMHQQRHTLD